MGPTSMTGVLRRTGKYRHGQREGNVRLEAEIVAMHLRTRECWRPSGAGRGKEGMCRVAERVTVLMP